MDIRIDENTAQLLEKRNIRREDLMEVIGHAEETGQKFHHRNTGRFLAHRRIGGTSYHALYSRSGDECTVLAAYWHQSELS